MMIAEIPASADPWLGLVAVGTVVLGLVGFMRGAAALVVTAVLALVGGIVVRGWFDEKTTLTAERLNTASFFVALSVAALLVLAIAPKRA